MYPAQNGSLKAGENKDYGPWGLLMVVLAVVIINTKSCHLPTSC